MRQGILVLGLGSRLMMDDGAGVAVVEALASQGREVPGVPVRYEVGETDFAYSLALAGQAGQLILVDAVAAGLPPGSVSVWRLGELRAAGPGLSQHQAHLVDLLLQSGLDVPALLIGIEPYRVAFHLGLSPEMEAQLDEIAARVWAAIARIVTGRLDRIDRGHGL